MEFDTEHRNIGAICEERIAYTASSTHGNIRALRVRGTIQRYVLDADIIVDVFNGELRGIHVV